jgi:hypothetical protein
MNRHRCRVADSKRVENDLPVQSPFRLYIIKRMYERMIVTTSSVGVTAEHLKDHFSTNFMLDCLLVLVNKPSSKLLLDSLGEDLDDPCNFHEHTSDQERTACRQDQSRNREFYVSFLRAIIEQMRTPSQYHQSPSAKLNQSARPPCQSITPKSCFTYCPLADISCVMLSIHRACRCQYSEYINVSGARDSAR